PELEHKVEPRSNRKEQDLGNVIIIVIFQDNGTSQSKQKLCFRQEPLEYTVHDNDASESLQPSWGKMCTSGT
nr:hypothetical protein [Tanacetum cinerariifolium]